jgi:UDP-galactopyranose mutase
MKNLIVGCGFSGVTLARKIAKELNQKVVVIDIKPHVCGNSYD